MTIDTARERISVDFLSCSKYFFPHERSDFCKENCVSIDSSLVFSTSTIWILSQFFFPLPQKLCSDLMKQSSRTPSPRKAFFRTSFQPLILHISLPVHTTIDLHQLPTFCSNVEFLLSWNLLCQQLSHAMNTICRKEHHRFMGRSRIIVPNSETLLKVTHHNSHKWWIYIILWLAAHLQTDMHSWYRVERRILSVLSSIRSHR